MYLLIDEKQVVYKEPTNGRYYAVRILYPDLKDPVIKPDYKHEVKKDEKETR